MLLAFFSNIYMLVDLNIAKQDIYTRYQNIQKQRQKMYKSKQTIPVAKKLTMLLKLLLCWEGILNFFSHQQVDSCHHVNISQMISRHTHTPDKNVLGSTEGFSIS